jgi:hypothetical protein
MGRAVAPIRGKRRGHFRYSESMHFSFDDHFQRELHPLTLQSQSLDGVSAETAKTAIEVAAFFAGEEKTSECS